MLSMNRSAWSLVAVIAISSVVLITNLGGPRLWDRDEPRNASCAAEMLERGDWVVPVMNAELRSHKPVMLYWVTMAFYSTFGVSEFTARIGSALAGIGSVLLTYAIGARLFSQKAAYWGAIALATMLMFNVAARAATPDAILIFFIMGTLTAFVYAVHWEAESPSPASARLPLGPAALMYLCAAGAVLTKGPVGVILPMAIAGAFMMTCGYRFEEGGARSIRSLVKLAGSAIWQTPGRFCASLWQLRPILGTAILAVVAVPWYVWVGVRTQGAWLDGFFLEHNIGRFNESMEGHGGSILYYPVALLIGSFPWSALLIPVCLLLRQAWPENQKRGIVFCLCWLVVIVGIFSLAKTKLPSYITPCYPGLALISGWFLSRLMDPTANQARQWTIASGFVLIVIGVGISVGLPIAATLYLPGEQWLATLGLLPIVGGAFVIYAVRKRSEWAAPALATCAGAMMISFFAFAADRVDSHRRHEELFSAIDSKNKLQPIAVWGVLEPSWVFYSQRSLEVVESHPTSRRVVPSLVDGKWRKEPVETPSDFLQRHPDGILVTTRKLWNAQRREWESELVEIAEAPYFLKQDELIALQRRESVALKSKASATR
jgi:4-amino-4-deoxy-L-arabinose transferase-like glycosyltransferase